MVACGTPVAEWRIEWTTGKVGGCESWSCFYSFFFWPEFGSLPLRREVESRVEPMGTRTESCRVSDGTSFLEFNARQGWDRGNG